MEYGKIDTLFERDSNFIVDAQKLKHPVIATINTWDVTEKVDGTNIRVMLDADGTVRFGGRTDNAQMPTDLLQYLMRTFTADSLKSAMWIDGVPTTAVLYGEGYGAGIHRGGSYLPDRKAFRLFDVLIVGEQKWWLDWGATVDVACKLGIKTVPYLGRWSLDEIVNQVRRGIPSIVAMEDNPEVQPPIFMEGIVARPIEPLFDRKGHRLIIKLKTRDFVGGKRR